MTAKDDDQKSVAKSVSSAASFSTNMAVIRFNLVDEMLFASFWTFYKEKKLPITFWLLCLLWTVISILSITFNFHNWPLWGWPGKIILDFFLFVLYVNFFKFFI
jgi:hypothetical protein